MTRIQRMLTDFRSHKQIAGRAPVCTRGTLATEAHAAAIDRAGRHLHVKRFDAALGITHAHLLDATIECFIEAHVERHVHIAALLRLRLVLPAEARTAEAASAENIIDVEASGARHAFTAANAIQNVGPAAEAAKARSPSAAAPSIGNALLIGGSVLVVKLALLLIAQDLIGLVDFLELFLIAACIGVVRACKLAIGLLNLFVRGAAGNPERLVVVRRGCQLRHLLLF